MSVEHSAVTVLQTLDARLHPKVFMVGIPDRESVGTRPVWIHARDEYEWGDALEQIRTHEIYRSECERPVPLSHRSSGGFTEPEVFVEGEALLLALLSVFQPHLPQQQCMGTWHWHNNYFIFLFTALNQRVYDGHADRAGGKYHLLDTSVRILQSKFVDTLQKSSNYKVEVIHDNHHSLIRQGAELLLQEIGTQIDIYDLFDTCQSISILDYENMEGIGWLAIAPEQQLPAAVELKTPVDLTDFRASRKLLEMSNDTFPLLVSTQGIYGIGDTTRLLRVSQKNYYSIQFLGRNQWQLMWGNQSLMLVRFGRVSLSRKLPGRHNFQDALERKFPYVTPRQINRLWRIVVGAVQQSIGTILVISSQAQAEAQRLRNESTQVVPFRLNSHLIRVVVSIDGAVLLDLDAKCYAIGVILDGMASDSGDPTRGSRYNSTIRYAESHGDCVAVVISNDGMIDFIAS